MGAAITTFIGQNIGVGRLDRVKLCVKQGFILTESITVTMCALVMLLAKPMLRLLTNDPAVIETTGYMLWFFVPFYCIWTVIEVLSGVLRGADAESISLSRSRFSRILSSMNFAASGCSSMYFLHLSFTDRSAAAASAL